MLKRGIYVYINGIPPLSIHYVKHTLHDLCDTRENPGHNFTRGFMHRVFKYVFSVRVYIHCVYILVPQKRIAMKILSRILSRIINRPTCALSIYILIERNGTNERDEERKRQRYGRAEWAWQTWYFALRISKTYTFKLSDIMYPHCMIMIEGCF